jgi:hypothetical protein
MSMVFSGPEQFSVAQIPIDQLPLAQFLIGQFSVAQFPINQFLVGSLVVIFKKGNFNLLNAHQECEM